MGDSRGISLSGADGGGKTAKKHNCSNDYKVIPVDPSFFHAWRKLACMSMLGYLPSRQKLLAADIYCEREWRPQKAVPILINRHGEPFSQKEATNFLRGALVELGGLSTEEAACFCLRSFRQGYLSYLHARRFGLEDISKLAAHESTRSTAGYLKNARGKRQKTTGKNLPKASKKQKLVTFLDSLPTIEVPENSEEAFNLMIKTAQDYLKYGSDANRARRTDNASRAIANDPFKPPKAWGSKWSFHSAEDRARLKISPQARTWGDNRRKTRGSMSLSSFDGATALIHLKGPVTPLLFSERIPILPKKVFSFLFPPSGSWNAHRTYQPPGG